MFVLYEEYESMETLLNILEKSKVVPKWESQADSWENPDELFSKVESREEYIRLAKTGYKEGVEDLQKFKMLVQRFEKKTKITNDVVGHTPNVPRFILGFPKDMINTKIKNLKGRILNIYCDMSISCMVSANQIIEAGAKIVAAIKNLELSGYRVNLYALCSGMSGPITSGVCNMLVIKLKDASEYLNLSKISFPLIHPAFLRGLFMEWCCKSPNTEVMRGYGRALRYNYSQEKIQHELTKAFQKDICYIPITDAVSYSMEKIKEIIVNK